MWRASLLELDQTDESVIAAISYADATIERKRRFDAEYGVPGYDAIRAKRPPTKP
ncbi:hypothetical protein [Pseudothauera rhizosphaerae]|uniref:hypothetical protein n=1 Tax=Pseudothauera rhizosphaerae TaxID=2565932 RepID=UPI001454C831|nr:hypothetical protein [Pseudothauera rhizosphaerae]